MSKIAFHTPHHVAYVAGSERQRFARFVTEHGIAGLGISNYDPTGKNERIWKALRLNRPYRDTMTLRVALETHEDQTMFHLPDGTTHRVVATFLNTTLAIGGSALQLAAHIHAKCEVHGWIESVDRDWLADAIESGMRSGPFSSDTSDGWRGVLFMMQNLSKEPTPVVLSHTSLSAPFPNSSMRGVPSDRWSEMSRGDRWDAAMAGLREREDLRIGPNTLLIDQGLTSVHIGSILR